MRSLLGLSVVTCVLAACRAPAQAGPSFTDLPTRPADRAELHFGPPLGEPLVEESSTSRVESAWEGDKQGPARSSRVEVRTSATWDASADGGYEVVQRVEEMKATVDGKVVEDPLLVLATRFPVTLRFAADGAFIELKNPEAVRSAVEQAFPDPEQQRTVLEFFTPEAVEDQARVEWSQRVGGLFGSPLESRHPQYAAEATAVGPLPLAYMVERQLRGTADTPWGKAVVLDIRCVQAAERAVDAEGWRAAWDVAGQPALDPSLGCEGEQVIALSPFVSVGSRLTLKARPADASGRVAGELTLERKSSTRVPPGRQ